MTDRDSLPTSNTPLDYGVEVLEIHWGNGLRTRERPGVVMVVREVCGQPWVLERSAYGDERWHNLSMAESVRVAPRLSP